MISSKSLFSKIVESTGRILGCAFFLEKKMSQCKEPRERKSVRKQVRRLHRLGWTCTLNMPHDAGMVIHFHAWIGGRYFTGQLFVLHCERIHDIVTGRGEDINDYFSPKMVFSVFNRKTRECICDARFEKVISVESADLYADSYIG